AVLRAQGKVFDGTRSAPSVSADRFVVKAETVGSSTDRLDVSLTNLEAAIGTGGMWISEASGITLGGALASQAGITAAAGATIDISAVGSIGVNEKVEGAAAVTLTVPDLSTTGQNITVFSTGSISGGTITLRAGDDVSVVAGGSMAATGALAVTGDYQ